VGGCQSSRGGDINLSFRRRLGDLEIKEWEDLECLSRIHLTDEEDTVSGGRF
jgi:hypothetical protein